MKLLGETVFLCRTSGTTIVLLVCFSYVPSTHAHPGMGVELLPQQPTFSTVLQQAQVPPSSVPPGTIDPPRQEEPLPNELPGESPPPLLPTPTTPEPSPSVPETRVFVEEVEVVGSTVFSPEELQEVVAPFEGRVATFEDLLEIRAAIARLYTENGYITSGAFLPTQDITDGRIQIQVVEGDLERIEIRGLRYLREAYVRDRLERAGAAPVNINKLERALQLLQFDPAIASVQGELTAGTAPGRSVLILDIQEYRPRTLSLSVANRDSPSVGSIRYSAQLQQNSLLGLGDRLAADFGISEGITSVNVGYTLPINTRDGTLRLSYDNSRSEIIEEPFDPLDINGRTETYTLELRQPLHRSPSAEFALGLSLELLRSRTFILDDEPFSFSEGPEDGRSNITALRFTQEWVDRSTRRVLAARSQFSLGLNAFDATTNDGAPDGQFFSWLGQFQWVQALNGENAIAIARVAAQFTSDSLLPVEQFSIGGADTVRGYRQNQRVGDNGITGSLEVRLPIVNEPSSIGVIQLAPFFDIGTIWNRNGEVPTPSTLVSIGLGFYWQLDDTLNIRAFWGIPLNPVDDEGDSLQDDGFGFSVQWQPTRF